MLVKLPHKAKQKFSPASPCQPFMGWHHKSKEKIWNRQIAKEFSSLSSPKQRTLA